MLTLGCQCAGRGEKQINKFNLLVHVDSLKGTREPNEFGRNIFTGDKPRHFGQQNLLLTFKVQSACNSSPQNKLLYLDTFSRMHRPVTLKTPQIVNSIFVPVAAKSGSEEKAG